MADGDLPNTHTADSEEMHISNEDVYILFKENRHLNTEEMVNTFKAKFLIELDEPGPSDLSIYTRIKGIYDKVTYKIRGSKKKDFLAETFWKPKLQSAYISKRLNDTPRKRKLRVALSEAKTEAKKLKFDLSKASELDRNENLNADLLTKYYELLDSLNEKEQSFRQKIMAEQVDKVATRKQLTDLQEDFEKTLLRLEDVEQKLSKKNVGNLNRKLKRREKTIIEQTELIQNKTEKINHLEYQLNEQTDELSTSLTEIENKNEKISFLKESTKKLYHKISYYKNKSTKQQQSIELMKDNLEEEKISLKEKMDFLQKKEREIEQLRVLMEDDMIVTFADGKYNKEIREVIMELYSWNVSLNKVTDVIKTVLKRLAGKDIDRLPSKGLLSRLCVEARYLADKQVGHAMLSGTDLNSVLGNTLHSDGASKFHRHYEGYQITTTDGKTLSLGILELASGDANSLLEALQEKLTDIASAMSNIDIKTSTEKLITSIKNTMSDQAAVNPLFNSLLEEYRKTLLPKYTENWDSLSLTEKNKLMEMGHFFCRMHLLVNFAEEANKVLLKFETACLEGKGEYALPKSGESGTCRFIRTAAKAFHPRGHQAAGMPKLFEAYLDEVNEVNSLVQMEGNRFNIIFLNGGAVYYHHHHIKNFIMQLSNTNNLIKAVFEDLEVTVHLAGSRALGIIGKLITGPLMRYIYGQADNILDLNPILNKLQQSLQNFIEDSSPLLNAVPVFDENFVEIKKDKIYDALFKRQDEEFEILTQQSLEIMCAGLLVILEKQAHQQLEGGIHFNPSENLQLQASNVKPHNMASERDFAIFDNQLRFKPNATTVALEAVILWTHNKPANWLRSLPDETREQYFAEARANYSRIKQKLKDRRKIIFSKRKAKLEQLALEKEEKARKDSRKKQTIIDSVQSLPGKFWESTDDIDANLEALENDKQLNAVYAQLEYLRFVLTVKPPETFYFQKSFQKRTFSLVEKVSHLKEIIESNEDILDINNEQQHIQSSSKKRTLVPIDKRTVNVDEQKSKVLEKIRKGKIQKNIKSSKTLLDELSINPEKLVGRRIKHKIQESADDIAEWYDGTVISIDTIIHDGIKTKFQIIYDQDGEDEVFVFPLLQNLRKGELMIID